MNTVPADMAYWRELHHPGERRFWRCRPTPLGVQVQFRDETEDDWGSRVLAFKPPPEGDVHGRQRVESHLGSFESTDASPVHQYHRRMEAAAIEALALVHEQLADGFVDVSRDAGAQFWELCEETWRFQSSDRALVEQLCARARAVDEETRLRVGRALTRRASGRWSSSLHDRPAPQTAWWPLPSTDEERAEAQGHLLVRRDEAALLWLALRLETPSIASDAMQSLVRVGVDHELGFAVLYDLLVHPGLYYALPHEPLMALARQLEPRTERIAALLAFGEDAPTASGARLADEERHFQRGFQAFAMLACWTRSDAAADALYDARPLTSKQCILIAAETHPRRRWAASLKRQRGHAAVDERERYDAAIAACLGANDTRDRRDRP